MSIADWSKPLGGFTVSRMSRAGGRDVVVAMQRRHKRVPFVNIAFLSSRSIKRRQWKHKLDYYAVVFAHLASGVGLKRKTPRGWIEVDEFRTRGVVRINEMGPNENCVPRETLGDQWDRGPMRWGTSEMGDHWDGPIIAGLVKWGTNEKGNQWVQTM